jgi:hypothetical protein
MFGSTPGLRRICAHLGVQFVRTLFGFLPGTPEHSLAKSEQHANKVRSNPGTNPAPDGKEGCMDNGLARRISRITTLI